MGVIGHLVRPAQMEDLPIVLTYDLGDSGLFLLFVGKALIMVAIDVFGGFAGLVELVL